MPLFIVYTFRDNNGSEAQTRIPVSQDANFSAVLAFSASTALMLQALSDAALVKYELRYTVRRTGPFPTPSPDSLRRTTVLFYRNGDDTSSIAVPGRTTLPVDTDGPYAGVRVSRSMVGLSGMLPAVDALLDGTLDPVGRPYGNSFSVGTIIGEGV